MKPIRWFPAVFFFTIAPILLAGCYTHLATTGGGYYVYHSPRPVYSDTMHRNGSLETPLVTYDTTMHGDTMFIDEHRVQPDGIASNGATPNETGNTIVNNYYGSGSYWDSYWGPSWGISVGFGWPYYNTWYSPWWPYYYTSNYYSDWWQPYGYFGYYPPYYNCYNPFFNGYYAGYYAPYYDGYYGHHHFGGFDRGYGLYQNIQPGRVGGEYRAGVVAPRATAPGIAPPSVSATALQSRIAAQPAVIVRQPSLAQANAADVLRTAEDRNAPVHVLSPDASAALNRSSAPVARVNTPGPGTVAMNVPNASASASFHPVIVRRMNGQTITSTYRAGHPMVVVRRAANYGSYNNAGYRSNGYQYNGSRSGGYRSYSPSARSYSPSARSYTPSARSYTPSQGYSAPAQGYSPPQRSYSPPERSYSPPDRSSAPSGGGGRSYGGGSSEGRAGGGEGRGR